MHGTKGSIKLHNAMHCPNKISVQLKGEFAAVWAGWYLWGQGRFGHCRMEDGEGWCCGSLSCSDLLARVKVLLNCEDLSIIN